MKRIILFSEILSETACEAAEKFVRQGHRVYALSEETKRAVSAEGVCYLNAAAWREEEAEKALAQIEEGYLDILVLAASRHCSRDGDITEGHNYGEMLQVMDENVNGAYNVFRKSLPLLYKGKEKRIAVITEERASINRTREKTDYAYLMSLASIHMMQKILFNRLRPEGFTFRNYAADKMGKGMCAADYILGSLCYNEEDEYIHSDENRLVMRNSLLCEIPW